MSKAEQALRSISGGVDTGTPTVLPSLPTVPKTGDANVEQFMSALKQTVETWAGKRGDSLDSAVTWRELVNKKFAAIDLSGTGVGSGGSGGSGSVVPVDPNADVDYTPPPAPTGLVATGALSTIILDWDVPTYTNHAYTEIWRSGTNVLGSAELVGMTPGAVYSDSVGGGFTYYYWIRFVSKANVSGAYNKTDGTMGQTSLDPGYLLAVLNGQISESELATALSTRINLIDDPATKPGSVAARIKTETDARISGDSALQTQINTVSATASSAAAAVQTEATARASGDSANATLINQVQARLDTGDYAAVKTESSASASAITGIQSKYSVKVDANGYVSGFGIISSNNNATPYSQFIFKADQFAFGAPGQTSVYPFVIQASATTVNGVAVPAGVYIDAAYIKNGTITNAKIGNAAIDTAKISDLAVTTAKIGDANITTAKIADAAITNAKISNLDAGKITTGYLAADRIDANSITASKIDSRGLAIKDLSGNIILAAGSSLNSSYLPGGANGNLVRSFKAWTLSGSISVVTGNLRAEDRTVLVIPSGANSQAASSPTLNLSTGTSYTVSFKAWTLSGSRTLYVDLYPDTLPESSVVVTSEVKEYSFTWSSTNASMSSCVLRFFAGAEAADLRIVNAKLELGDTRTPWVPHYQDSVNVNNQITSENVSTYIANAAIQNAHIGNIIQSSNYVSGSSGWRIDKAGSAEFGNGYFRGDITGATGTFNGKLSAGTVNLSELVGVTEQRDIPGTYYFTLSSDQSKVRYQLLAGGGGGGSGKGGEWNWSAGGGGGGGAGQFLFGTIALSPGTQIRVVVGSGGGGASTWATAGTSGTASELAYFNTNTSSWVTLITAIPGGGGAGAPIASGNDWDGVVIGGAGGSGYPAGSAGVSGWNHTDYDGTTYYYPVNGGAGASAIWGFGGSPGVENIGWGTSGSGYGAGGGGGAGYAGWRHSNAHYIGMFGGGGSGSGGKAIVEMYSDNTVVLRSELVALKQSLANQGIIV